MQPGITIKASQTAASRTPPRSWFGFPLEVSTCIIINPNFKNRRGVELARIIAGRIKKEGAIPFRDFMETALYHPELGYYTKNREIGKRGDYYTSPHVSPMFGRFLARGLKEMACHLQEECHLPKEEVTLVELGGGRGVLAEDILQELDYRYILVEPHTKPEGGVEHCKSLEELPRFNGIAFSNELLDALPVNLVEQTPEGLKEVYVDYCQGRFTEICRQPHPSLEEYLEKARITLPQGYRCEVNLEALHLLEKINSRLKKGFLLTIDYGHYSEETPRYPQGTLRCYHKHTQNNNPYQNIGTQDITSNVNFTSLIIHGEKIGLKLTGTTNQTRYILGMLERGEKPPEDRLKLKNLLIMGEAFQMLVQHKGLKKPPQNVCDTWLSSHT